MNGKNYVWYKFRWNTIVLLLPVACWKLKLGTSFSKEVVVDVYTFKEY